MITFIEKVYNNNELTLELTAYVDEKQYMIQGYRSGWDAWLC